MVIIVPIDSIASKVVFIDSEGHVHEGYDWMPELGYELHESLAIGPMTETIKFELVRISRAK